VWRIPIGGRRGDTMAGIWRDIHGPV
jgi:hypothetical protein